MSGRDFFDPTPEQQNVILVRDIRKVEELIESCEHCNPIGGEVSEFVGRTFSKRQLIESR